jgi:hypothetical protein
VNGSVVSGAFAYAENAILELRINSTSNHVEYVKNKQVLFTSTGAPAFPIRIRANFRDAGATVHNTKWLKIKAIPTTTSGGSFGGAYNDDISGCYKVEDLTQYYSACTASSHKPSQFFTAEHAGGAGVRRHRVSNAALRCCFLHCVILTLPLVVS